jgi:tetratricopeptide (TPR) repeat protein
VELSSARQYGESDRAYRIALAGDPANGTILSNIAGNYMEIGRHASFDSVMEVYARERIPFPTAQMRYTDLWMRRDYAGAERVVRMYADTAQPRNAVDGMRWLAGVAELRGRLHEAERRQAQASDASARIRGDTADAYRAAYFHAQIDGMLRGDTARALATLDSVLRVRPIASVPMTRDQSLWLVFAYAEFGAPAKARAVLDGHEARLDALRRRQEESFATQDRGLIALAEGRVDSAIAYFRRSDMDSDGLPAGNCTVCAPILLGFAFDRAGHADSARKYLTEFAQMDGTSHVGVDQHYLAPTLFRLGELYENAGDAAHATEYYGRFVDLWAKADPELQPRVADARRRIEQLNRAKR